MKHSPSIYAKAFAKAVTETPKEKQEELLRNFMKILKRHGAEKQSRRILEETEKILVKKKGGRSIVIETARPLSKKSSEVISASFGKDDIVKTKIRPELIAGVRIVIDGESAIDGTMKHKLHKLFAKNQ